MARRLKCGHNADWTIRLIDRGERYSYCIGCMVEKIGLESVEGRVPKKAEQSYSKIMGEKKNELNKKDVQKTKV